VQRKTERSAGPKPGEQSDERESEKTSGAQSGRSRIGNRAVSGLNLPLVAAEVYQLLIDYQNSLTDTLSNNFPIKWLLKIPPQLKRDATLPRKLILSLNLLNLRGSGATLLRCGGIVNDPFIENVLLSVNQWEISKIGHYFRD